MCVAPQPWHRYKADLPPPTNAVNANTESTPETERWTRLNELRVVGSSGTNKVMSGELSRLSRRALPGVRLPEPRKMGTGALIYPFDAELACVATFYLRTCTRVFWDLVETRSERLEPLYEDLRAALAGDLAQWVQDGTRISVEAHDVRTFAAGERQVVGTVKNAWVDAAAQRGLHLTVDPERPEVVIAVRADEGTVRVSIDLAGRAMNQRGYRSAQGLAPLREDTAAVLLMLARFDPRSELLIDPMAGSGTLAIEAACMADARPTWVPPRGPLIANVPALRDRARRPTPSLFADTEAHVLASDHDGDAIRLLQHSMVATHSTTSIATRIGDFRALNVDGVRRWAQERGIGEHGCLIVSNPPYGERLGDPDLIGLYRDLGRWCRQFRGGRAAFLVANPDFERAFGGRPRIKKPLRNGPLRAYFYLYDL